MYSSARGDLSGFGYPNVEIEINGDEDVSAALASSWGQPLLDEGIDHGIVVPLILWEPKVLPTRPIAILAAALSESSTNAEARSFARALLDAAPERTAMFVASVNGSAGLTPRAPLTEIDGARALEDRLLEAVRTDATRVAGIAGPLAEEAGSCSAGPLIAFSELFAGRAGRVLAHEAPVGVGYTVAVTDD